MNNKDRMTYVIRIAELIVLIAILVILLVPIANKALSKNDCANPNINPDKAQYWREVLQLYRHDADVNQMLLVKYTGGCDAIAEYYIKSDSNHAWELKFTDNAYVGKNGISADIVEGNCATPVGDYGIRKTAFGILPNPGTKLEWIDVTPNTYACDEDTELYNQIFDISKSDHKDCKGEEMYIYSPEYNYGFTMEHNPNNEYPLQSNIFIHCKGAKPFTGGCVALDQEHIKTILTTCDEGMRVVVNDIY